MHEFSIFANKNELNREYEYNAIGISVENIELEERILWKVAKNIFKY